MSTDKMVADVTKVVDELVKSGEPIGIPVLGKLGQQIANSFSVKSDEVAMMALVIEGKFLKFVVPEKLQNIGTIPVTSTTALAARDRKSVV